MAKRKPVYGIGIYDIEESAYQLIDGKRIKHPIYCVWTDMIRRCYSAKDLLKNPTYTGCTVHADWHLFSNFKQWMIDNRYEGMHLDKDILIKGNKVYGPDTCALVPNYVNQSLIGVTTIKPNRKYPLGAGYNGYYYATMSNKNYGYGKTALQAHHVWQNTKADHLESVVFRYAQEECFRTDVADALLARAWTLRLHASQGVETITL